jgi:hypothetical protein
MAIASSMLGGSGCTNQEQANPSDRGEGGMTGELGAGAGGEGAENSGGGRSGGSAGSANPRMCHLDCVAREYCEDSIVYRVSRGASAQFPCGTPPPPLECTAYPFEYCDYSCATNGVDCADSSGVVNGGAGGQGGDAGRADAGADGD